jgi:hypothetical protein
MANGTYVKFTGTGKWMHRLFTPDEKFGKYNMILYPDKKSLKDYVKAGCQGTIKTDEDGDHVRLQREVRKMKRDGTIWELGPPKVYDQNGDPWNEEVLIGNGSKVEVTADVYDTSKGKGTRLVSVKVLEHVPYEKAVV